MSQCLRGCTIQGEHKKDCDGQECSGCLPSETASGNLCPACTARPAKQLADIGELAGWIRENVTPGTRRDPIDVNYVDMAEAPLSIEALTDLDELSNAVFTWVRIAIEEHPGNLHGPDLYDTRVVPRSKRRAEWGAIVYDPARIVGTRAGADGKAISAAADWMISFTDWYAAQPWADQWHDEIVQSIKVFRQKWPTKPRIRKAPIPCPRCDFVSLWWHPANMEKGDARVICHNDACPCVLTEEDYWIKVMDRRNERIAQQERERAAARKKVAA